MNTDISSEIGNRNTPMDAVEYTIAGTLDTLAQHRHIYKAMYGNSMCVLKCVKKETEGVTQGKALLEREYEILSTLLHPYIIHTSGLINHNEVGECIVLDYIDGRNLDSYIKENRSEKERRRILMQIIDAVEYLHKKGVIHADLKPSNILIRNNGDFVVIIDFGLSDTDATIFKNIGYTKAYAAPEQVKQEQTTYATDIFAVGKIMEVLLPSKYKQIKKKCLATKPENRFENISSVRKAIEKSDSSKKALLITAILFILIFINIGAGIGAGINIAERNLKSNTDEKLTHLMDSLHNEYKLTYEDYINMGQDSLDSFDAFFRFTRRLNNIRVTSQEKFPEYGIEIEEDFNTQYNFYYHKGAKYKN